MRYTSFLYDLYDNDSGLLESVLDGFYAIFEAELTPEEQTYIDADPTPNKKYKVWILRMKKAGLKSEDLYKITEYLTIFDKYKQKLEVKDINQYKSVNDLFTAIAPIKRAIDSGDDLRSDNQKRKAVSRAADDIDTMYESNGWRIYHPKTKDAACLLGKNTEWCTATRSDNNMFDHYNEEGPMYVVMSPEHKKWQFHGASNQFMDVDDKQVNDISIFPIDVTIGIAKLFGVANLITRQLTDEQHDALMQLLQGSDDTQMIDALKTLMVETGNPKSQQFIIDHIHVLDDVDLRGFLYKQENFANIVINASMELLVYLYDYHAETTHTMIALGGNLTDAIHTIMIRDQFNKFKFLLRAGAGENPFINSMVIDRVSQMLTFNDPKYEYYRKYGVYVMCGDYPVDDADESIVANFALLFRGVSDDTKISRYASERFEEFYPVILKSAISSGSNSLTRCMINLKEYLTRTQSDTSYVIDETLKYGDRIVSLTKFEATPDQVKLIYDVMKQISTTVTA